MILAGVVVLIACATALLLLPRRWAFAPMVVGACLMTMGQIVILGPFHFTVVRILIAVGAVRAVLRQERLPGGWTTIDSLFVLWAGWMLASSSLHEHPSSNLITKLGIAYDGCGLYFLMRAFFPGTDTVKRSFRFTALLLCPIALSMLHEHIASKNLFGLLGGVKEEPMVRDGKIRASGPFRHPILAGTVGATAIPMMAFLWKDHRAIATLGAAAGLTMILCSNSSGPLMTLMAAVLALSFWPYRKYTRVLRWAAVLGYIALDIVMKDPAYFILARIDLTGSSTGWHRAQLIRSSFAHLDEWWLAGTDYTRDWMATGVSSSPNHTDFTNHYLYLGVLGGLPLTILFLLVVFRCFSMVGRCMRRMHSERYLIWTIGCALLCHAVTFVSVSYFDQSIIFFYLTVAVIASLYAVHRRPHTYQPVCAGPLDSANWFANFNPLDGIQGPSSSSSV